MYAAAYKNIPSQLYQIERGLKELDKPGTTAEQIFNQMILSYKTLNEIVLCSLDLKKIKGHEADIDAVNKKVKLLCGNHIFDTADKEKELLDSLIAFESRINELQSEENSRINLEKVFALVYDAFEKWNFKDLYGKELLDVRNLNLRKVDNRIYSNSKFIQFIRDNCPKIQGLIMHYITDKITRSLPKQLNYLKVDCCFEMTQKGWKAMAKLPQLTYLDLTGFEDKNFSVGEDIGKSFARTLKKMTSLKTLCLKQRDGILHIQDEFLSYLPKQLKSLELDISGSFVGTKWARQIRKLKNLESLAFYDLRPSGLKEGLRTILNQNTTLQKLTLIRVFNDDKVVKTLAKALEGNQNLQTLDLTNNKIGEEGAVNLAIALKVNRTLMELNLDNNQIGFEGIRSLSEALVVNSSLKMLDITSNNIDDEQAKILSKSLEKNKALQILNLPYNKIDNEGAKAIALALKVNSSLIELRLSRNKISAMGRQSLIGSIQDNNSLKILDISHHEAETLNRRLKKNKSLQESITKYNEIMGTEELNEDLKDLKVAYALIELQKCSKALYGTNELGILSITEAIKKNKSLKILDISGNIISEEEKNALDEGLEENNTLKIIY